MTSNPSKVISSLIGIVVLIALVLLFSPFTVVNAGQEAVIVRNGEVTNTVGAGLHWYTPFIGSAIKYDIRTQLDKEDASAASSDLQTVSTTVALNYNIQPQDVAQIYTHIGSEDQISSVVIQPAVQEVVKAVTAKYTAEQLITDRAQVQSDIQEGLTQRLSPYWLQVSSVSITNFDFSDQFNQAVEAKVTAEQNALAAQNKVQQTQAEASSTIIQAQAQAEAIKIQAQAVESQGGSDYVQLQAIKQWDGHLPAQMVPGSSVPFLNITK